MNVKHLGKYLARSRERLQKQLNFMAPDHVKKEIVDTLLIKELQSGVQTIQYQINTLMTTNGL